MSTDVQTAEKTEQQPVDNQTTAVVEKTEAVKGNGKPEVDKQSVAKKAEAKKPVAKKAEAKKPVAKKPEAKKAEKKVEKPAFTITEADQTWLIPLSRITKTENPREEPAQLASLGYKLIDGNDKEHSLLHMALSSDIEIVKAFVELVEEHEAEVFSGKMSADEPSADLSNMKYKEPAQHQSRSIVSLAYSLTERQLEPVAVRRGAKTKDDSYNYNLIFGQRRVAAMAYAWAKNRVEEAEGNKKGVFKDIRPMILAVEVKCNEEEAFEMAVAENLERKDFTPVQEGRIYYAYTQRTNPATGKKWTLKDVAIHLFGDAKGKYGHVRNRWALAVPYKPDEVDNKGNVTKHGRGLTEEERSSLERSEKTLTWAVRKALREEHYNPEGTRQKNRTRGLPLKEMQKLFDNCAEDNVEARTMCAMCMGLTLKQAEKESEKRIEASDNKDARKAHKAVQKSKKTGANKSDAS